MGAVGWELGAADPPMHVLAPAEKAYYRVLAWIGAWPRVQASRAAAVLFTV